MPKTENPGIQLAPGTPKIVFLDSSLFDISYDYANPGDDFHGGGSAALDNIIKLFEQEKLGFLMCRRRARIVADLGDTIS